MAKTCSNCFYWGSDGATWKFYEGQEFVKGTKICRRLSEMDSPRYFDYHVGCIASAVASYDDSIGTFWTPGGFNCSEWKEADGKTTAV